MAWRIALLMVLILAGKITAAEKFDPWAGPKETAIFIGDNPWNMVIGSDTPTFALYEDGEVVFGKKVEGQGLYYHKRLEGAELATVLNKLGPVLALKNLKKHYNVVGGVTDQSTAHFYLRLDGKTASTHVYGLTSRAAKDEGPEPPPHEVFVLYDYLTTVDFPGSEPWTPKYIEVMLWPYEYAPDESIHWPKDWPSLESARAQKRGESSYSIYLDASELPRLKELAASRKEKGALEVEGKKWSLAFRYVFPNEPAWRHSE